MYLFVSVPFPRIACSAPAPSDSELFPQISFRKPCLVAVFSLCYTENMDDTILNDLIEYLKGLHHVPASEIPSLSLYMDQVTAFMERHLSSIKRHSEDKILTKTMINNYTKNKLLPPPEKKRYSENHILVLLFIYYYKGILSLSDIETILRPIEDKYFDAGGPLSLEEIYERVFSLADSEMSTLLSDIRGKYERAKAVFPEEEERLSPKEKEELRLFAFLGELGFDVYLKRQLMERIVDRIREEHIP